LLLNLFALDLALRWYLQRFLDGFWAWKMEWLSCVTFVDAVIADRGVQSISHIQGIRTASLLYVNAHGV
jgi:hypothetical protein